MRNDANDKDVPEDEMLLAEAIAAAKGRGLGWCSDVPFKKFDGTYTGLPDAAVACCALGALHLAGRVDMGYRLTTERRDLRGVIHGNDTLSAWNFEVGDNGESLGWAFRCAMTQGDE